MKCMKYRLHISCWLASMENPDWCNWLFSVFLWNVACSWIISPIIPVQILTLYCLSTLLDMDSLIPSHTTLLLEDAQKYSINEKSKSISDSILAFLCQKCTSMDFLWWGTDSVCHLQSLRLGGKMTVHIDTYYVWHTLYSLSHRERTRLIKY